MTPPEAVAALAAALAAAVRNFYGQYEDWPDDEARADAEAYAVPHILAALAASGWQVVPTVPANWQDRDPNHYDWFMPAHPISAVDAYLDDFETKMRESLTDFWVHDMAQSVLPLIAAYRQARAALASPDQEGQ